MNELLTLYRVSHVNTHKRYLLVEENLNDEMDKRIHSGNKSLSLTNPVLTFV